jgi:large subunit ribosomal protein L30
MAKIKIKQIKSVIGKKPSHIKNIKALGLKRIGHVVHPQFPRNMR